MARPEGRLVYRIKHRQSGIVWCDRRGKKIWLSLHDAVQAYNDNRFSTREPCYSAQTKWVAVANRLKVVR